jgi:hypothetical protein
MKHLILFLIALGVVLVATYIIVHNKADAPELTEEVSLTPGIVPLEEPTIPTDIAAHIASKSDLIVLTSPAPYDTINSPVSLTGKARGYWFFEASFPVTVVNWDGLIIGEGIATAGGEWMTEEFVPFTASITFTVDPDVYSKNGALILQRDNPSGLPENDNALEIPVIFK